MELNPEKLKLTLNTKTKRILHLNNSFSPCHILNGNSTMEELQCQGVRWRGVPGRSHEAFTDVTKLVEVFGLVESVL